MPVHEFTNVWSNASDAAFTAWVNAMTSALEAVGLVRTADTGQAAPGATLSRPSAGGRPHYVVYALNDTMQGTAPLYLKVAFGATSGGQATVGVWVTVGTGTDGAGGITGVMHAERQITPGSSLVMDEPGVASRGDGYVSFVGAMIQGQGPWFILERTRDSNGAPTAMGSTLATGPTMSTPNAHQGNPMVETAMRDTQKRVEMVPPVVVPYRVDGVVMSTSSSLTAGGVGPVFPWVLFGVGRAPWQSCAVISIPAGDYPAGVIQTVLCGNVAHFRPIPMTARQRGGVALEPNAMSTTGGNANVALAIRWEE